MSSMQCYLPNGQPQALGGALVPCQIDPVRTICCATNRTNPAGGNLKNGQTADECLMNGLCQNRLTYNGNNETHFYINTCTNKDLLSGQCLSFCDRNAAGSSEVTSCDGTANSTRWCCGFTRACCDKENGDFTLPQIFGQSLQTASSSLHPSSSIQTASFSISPSSSTTTATPSASHAPQTDSNGLSTGAKAGLAVAAVVAVMILLLLALFARKAYSWKKDADAAASEGVEGHYGHVEKYGHSLVEPYSKSPLSELPPTPEPTELAGTELPQYHQVKLQQGTRNL